MIAQILQILALFWHHLIPFVVMKSEECGFIRRWGVPHRTLEPGFTWKWRLWEVPEIEDAREYTTTLDPQSLTTKDGVEVVVRATVRCHVCDARKYITGVCDGRTNIQELVAGELSWLVQRRTAAEVKSGAILPDLVKRSVKVAREWGIHIETIRFLDSVSAPSYRLWQSQLTSSGQE